MGVRVSKLSKVIGGGRGVNRLGLVTRLSLAPKGYVPVCVGVNGGETKRFIVHMTTLRDSDFLEFLCRSAEEYGFCNDGILRIPFEAREFEEWLMMRRAKPKKFKVKQS